MYYFVFCFVFLCIIFKSKNISECNSGRSRYFPIQVCNKGFIHSIKRIYKNLPKISKKKAHNLIKKWDIQRAHRHIESCLMSVAFKKMQVKTPVLGHCTATTMIKIVKMVSRTSSVEDTTPSEINHHQKTNTAWDQLYKVSKVTKFLETEGKGGLWEGKQETAFSR